MNIAAIEPSQVWTHFSNLNAVPRASKKEERVIAFIKSFGESLGLYTQVDATGNILIKKPATVGKEDRPTIVLQGHIDMVHQKNSDTTFDFDTQGIDMFIDGDWVKARGTTLGADNGLGVATMMALLSSKDIPHPPLEALFTIDEETGMTGAKGLQGGWLSGSIMLNLDTEEDHILIIGCAGGIDVTGEGTYTTKAPSGDAAFELHLSGLKGGHSGLDIHIGRANANKLMNRFLLQLQQEISIEVASIDGGSLRNAIPRESKATIVVRANDSATLQRKVAEFKSILEKEYQTTDSNLQFKCSPSAMPSEVADTSFLNNFLRAVYAVPNGIYRMSPDVEKLVQTSNNLARIQLQQGKYSIQCLTRSSVDSEKLDLKDMIHSIFDLLGAQTSLSGDYPGWTPQPQSEIVQLCKSIYKEMYGNDPLVVACHAGLECGILGKNYPNMQMISFGPTIHGAHSPEERASISSMQKFWNYFLEVVNRI